MGTLKSVGLLGMMRSVDGDAAIVNGGTYLQVAGGGATCMVERLDAKAGRRRRAYHDASNAAYPDGTLLVFRAG